MKIDATTQAIESIKNHLGLEITIDFERVERACFGRWQWRKRLAIALMRAIGWLVHSKVTVDGELLNGEVEQ